MAKIWEMHYTPPAEGNKLLATYLDAPATITEVDANSIAIYAGDNVPMYAQNTMTSGWKWLFDGVMDRNLLDGAPWAGVVLYTGSNWQIMTENDRRTESILSTITEDDIFIGMGNGVTELLDKVMLYAAFKLLTEFALEETLKAA